MGNNEETDAPDAIRELKWKEIMGRVDAYRFYIKLCLEANAFFFATTGVILGFYLNQPIETSNYYLKFFLLLPILMGTVLGSICIYATRLQKEGSRNIKAVREELAAKHGLEIELIPDIHLLDLVLIIFGSIFFLVAALLIPVPLLKATACLKCVDWFVVIACSILAGGGISTFFCIRDYDKKLKKRDRRNCRKSSKRISPPAISMEQGQHNKVAPDDSKTIAGVNKEEARDTGRKIEE
jgi:hypothetical protein